MEVDESVNSVRVVFYIANAMNLLQVSDTISLLVC